MDLFLLERSGSCSCGKRAGKSSPVASFPDGSTGTRRVDTCRWMEEKKDVVCVDLMYVFDDSYRSLISPSAADRVHGCEMVGWMRKGQVDMDEGR